MKKHRRSYRGHGRPSNNLARKPPVSEDRAYELATSLPPRDVSLHDPNVHELIAGLEHDAYEIAMQFSERWREDAENCWSIAHAALIDCVLKLDPERVQHGRTVFAFMQRCVQRALHKAVKRERQYNKEGDTRPWREQPRALHFREKPTWMSDKSAEDLVAEGTDAESVRQQTQWNYRDPKDSIDYFSTEIEDMPAPQSATDFVREVNEGLIDAIIHLFDSEHDRRVAMWMIDLLIFHDGNVSAVSADLFGLYGVYMPRQRIDEWREDLYNRYYDLPEVRQARRSKRPA
jgi:hypothetical protein